MHSDCLYSFLIILGIYSSNSFGQMRSYEPITLMVGGIIEKGNIAQEICFRKSVQEASKMLQKHDTKNRRIQLIPTVETIEGDDAYEALTKACKLLERRVIAIFGPTTPNAVDSVQSMANQFGIPHLQIDWGYHQSTLGFALNVHPHYLAFGQAIYDYISEVGQWNTVALIYYHEKSLLKYVDLLSKFDQEIMIRKWELANDDYQYVIKQFKTAGKHYHFIVDIPFCLIKDFFALANKYNMTSQYYSYVFTDWDVQLIPTDAFNVVSGANITTFSILQNTKEKGYGIDALIGDIRMEAQKDERIVRAKSGKPLSPTQAALLYDGLSLLAMGILATSRSADLVPPTDMKCTTSRVWNPGLTLMNNIKSIKPENFRGLTGAFQFDGSGWRSNVSLLITELGLNGFQEFGNWNMERGLNITKDFRTTLAEIHSELRGKILRITTKEERPYMMYQGETAPGMPKSTDSKDWRGFCIDLLNEIGNHYNFTYTINLVPDSTYGDMKIIDGKEVWDGIVRELQEKKADLAVGSFTITYDRERAIDFTTPFMYLGVSIIFKRIEDKRSHLFSFLQPLSVPVWGYILAATIMVSLVLFVVARFTPYEWKINHPCNLHSNVVENKFNVLNSIWYTFGALMQKGSDVVPHATSTRIIAGFWWFFTLIIISSYTANLAAYLTVARMEAPIENADDLSKQTKIKYGAVPGGSTSAFFQSSTYPTYNRMWKYMSSQKGLMMNNTEEAIQRVKREEYAFILESTMNEYYTHRNCELTQVGGLLDSKGYGIGLPQGSKYRDLISEMILKLQNEQTIDKLKLKWWKEEDILVSCDSRQSKKSESSSLGVEKVGGCFLMLLIGMGVALLVAVFEFFIHSYRRVIENKRSLREEIARDFRFSMACSSFRSQMAEEAVNLPPPPSLSCCTNGATATQKSSLSNMFAYAPCLPTPDLPIGKVLRGTSTPSNQQLHPPIKTINPAVWIGDVRSPNDDQRETRAVNQTDPSHLGTEFTSPIYRPIHPSQVITGDEVELHEEEHENNSEYSDDRVDNDDDGDQWLAGPSPAMYPGSPLTGIMGLSTIQGHDVRGNRNAVHVPTVNSMSDMHIKKVSC